MTRELSANSSLSHYRIIAKIGAGGMGEVYLAEDTRLDRKVALKLLPAEFTQDDDRVRRFMQEAKAASALNHPHIITVHDIGDSEAGRFIVMELVAGRTLRAIIAEDNSAETLLSLGSQMAKALSAAHAAGITHRDIKPDNIMVRDDGYVKILDFGLARLLPTTASDAEPATLAQQTTPGTLLGTVAYMSPEQARGQAVTPASDIFALGIVLHELATGQHPFKAETMVGYLHAITSQTPAPASSVRPAIPASLDALILRMLEKEAGSRPTASQVAQALEEIERLGTGNTLLLRTAPDEPSRPSEATTSGAALEDEGFWVAVLPFKYRGANADLEALAEGLSEEIVTGLSRFSYLRVIARSSTLRYASEGVDVRAFGKELGARYVMEGSLRQAGSVLRIAVQLVDASSGAHLWAETYDRSFSPEAIFELQDDVVPRIVSTVADWYGVLPHSMSEALRSKGSGQLSPYEAVLRSFGYYERVTVEEHAAARASLERAVQQAPEYADGWVMLSMMYGEEHRFRFNAQPDPLGRALQAARRAADAAPANHLAYLALAVALFFRREFPAFRSAAERAIALNPMDGSTIAYIGHLMAFAGDWERGCDVFDRARELNPHHPEWYWALPFHNAYRQGDYRGALTFAPKFTNFGNSITRAMLAALYGQLGDREAAGKALRELLILEPDFALIGRDELGKWYLPELVEHLMDGLRKAGLKVASERGTVALAAVVVVLPFVNRSPDPGNEYFSDGLTEEIITDLSRIEALRVISRNSSMALKGAAKDTSSIAKELGVTHVVSGSVRRAGDALRVTAELIDAVRDNPLWSEKYSGTVADVFGIQEEIARKIVAALSVRLTDSDAQPTANRPIDDVVAYDCYLRARQEMYGWTPESLDRATRLVDQALGIVGENPLLLATKGQISWNKINVMLDPDERHLDEAAECARRALALDPEYYLGFFLRGIVAGLRGETSPALSDTHRAHDLRPADPNVLTELCRFANASGIDVDDYVEELLAIDPLTPVTWSVVAFNHFVNGRLDEAVPAARRIIELAPGVSTAHIYAAWAFAKAGMRDEAIEILEMAGKELAGTLHGSWALFLRYALDGDAERSCAQMTPLLERGAGLQEHNARMIADGYSLIGRNDDALRWIRIGMDRGFINYPFLATYDPLLANVRSDPRFPELMLVVKARWEALAQNLPRPLRAQTLLSHEF